MSNGEKAHLVIGGTGRLGRELVKEMVGRDFPVRALVRKPERGELLPAGVELAVGDLGDKASLEQAMDNVASVFFIIPHHDEDARLGHNVLDVSQAAGVDRVVLSTAFHPDASSKVAMSFLYGLLGLMLPHYKGKWQVEKRLRFRGEDPVILMPSNYFQNDALFKKEIFEGLYPQPLGQKGSNRVDCRDVAAAATRALSGELESGAYPIVGSRSFTGPQCAEMWAAAINQDVQYGGDDLKAWEERVAGKLSAREVSDFGRTYKAIQKFGAHANEKILERSKKAVGREPTGYTAYIGDQIEAWEG